jgi:hypothetical protein
VTIRCKKTPHHGSEEREMPACCCQALASEYAIGFREMRTSKGVNARTSCYIEGGY